MITRYCHTWVKQDQAVASNEIEPTASSFAAEQEDKLVLLRVIEVLDQLLALVDAGTAIQSHKGILQHSRRDIAAQSVGSSTTDPILSQCCSQDNTARCGRHQLHSCLLSQPLPAEHLWAL